MGHPTAVGNPAPLPHAVVNKIQPQTDVLSATEIDRTRSLVRLCFERLRFWDSLQSAEFAIALNDLDTELAGQARRERVDIFTRRMHSCSTRPRPLGSIPPCGRRCWESPDPFARC